MVGEFFIATHTKNRTKDCSNVASFKQLFFFWFLQNDLTFREELVPGCWWNIRFGSDPISVTHAEIWGGVWWWVERVLFRHISTWIEWSPEWSKKMPLQGGEKSMEVTKTEGFSGVFHVLGSVMGSCKLFEVSNFCAAWGVKFLGFFFWSVRFSQKWRLPEDYFLNWNWKDCMALILFCVFFVVPDDQTCTEKCGQNV